MSVAPRVSVVTPSFNQGRFIARTIDSVRGQGYPNLEHIVVDGMSTDDTGAILARYPHLRVLREPDRGQSDAINKGFRLATGDILCFLNSDDTFLPGALRRVVAEINPARGRHIVMGRCRHIDEEDRLLPMEHPSAYLGHRRLLEVWKQHTIPQPATFWTAQVWRDCGPLDEREHMVPDYDLFCRFSRRYAFHFIDQVLATYRLHGDSKTCTRDTPEVLQAAIEVSRRYWGPKWHPQHWRLEASLAWHRLEQSLRRKHWAGHFADDFDQCKQDGNRLLALAYLAAAAACAPDLAFRRALSDRLAPLLAKYRPGALDLWDPKHVAPATLAWRGYTGQHANGCLGPTFTTPFTVGPSHATLHVTLDTVMAQLPQPINVDVYIDETLAHQWRCARPEPMTLALAVGHLEAGRHELKIVSSSYIVPQEYHGNGDYRPLALRLREVRVMAGVGRLAA